MNKYLLLIILLVTGLTGARAQYDSQLSQYFMALGYYNPAYAGVTGDLNMLALSRLQYVGIDGAPTVSTSASSMMPSLTFRES